MYIKYRSAINLFEYKIMRIGQFWRLKLYGISIMQFYCQKDSNYMTPNLWKEQKEEKKRLAYFGPRTMHYRGINLLVSLYDALLNPFFCLDSWLLVSKPHTKEQQRFRLHEQCLTPDLARSTQTYMHVSCESDFDSFKLNNLLFFILACVVLGWHCWKLNGPAVSK